MPGLPILRETCANHLSQHRGLDIHPDSIVVTPGAKPFLFYGIKRINYDLLCLLYCYSEFLGYCLGIYTTILLC